MNMRRMDRGRKKERGLTATGGWHGHSAHLMFTCVSFMPMWKCCSGSIGFSLSRKPTFFTPSPLTKSTSMRSGLTCPVFFGLFLKPCRGRQRHRVSTTQRLKETSLICKYSHRETRCSCTLCLHKHTCGQCLTRHTVHSHSYGFYSKSLRIYTHQADLHLYESVHSGKTASTL